MQVSLGIFTSILLLLFVSSCKEHYPPTTKVELNDPSRGLSIESVHHLGNSWQIVTVDPSKSKPSIQLADSAGKPLRDFSAFEAAAQKIGQTTVWMMNAGMYHKGGTPVGLCIINGKQITPVNTSVGEGNFFLKPNGIFLLTNDGARIIDTNDWRPETAAMVKCATQSGPLLVSEGKFHPAIRENSPNKLIRNGVGVRTDGHLCFLISTTPVSFHEMATFFRDHLNCPDALYLDGAVSALYVPKAKLTPQATGIGPVIGLWD